MGEVRHVLPQGAGGGGRAARTPAEKGMAGEGWGGGGVCGLNRVYLEAGTRVFCYLIKNKERQLPNKPYVGFWVGKAGNLNNLNNLNIGVDPGEGVGPGI